MSDKLLKIAEKYLSHSHSPYSKAQVASAVELENGEIFGGCNIENASYGGTVCAERVAIWKALSEYPGQKLKRVLVMTDTANPWPPCGFCRQVIAEFAKPSTEILLANKSGVKSTHAFQDILPLAFGAEDLKK
ncbi:MAG: cytidine deaminase [Bdellovibrionaceae bacterium]|nr:cytidine deaminase [Pseudobdellovibrionaceae bacterium]